MKFIDSESLQLIKTATIQNKLKEIIYILTLQAQNLKDKCEKFEKSNLLVYETFLMLLLQVSFFGDPDITPEQLEEISKLIRNNIEHINKEIEPKPILTKKHLSLIVNNE